MKSFIEFLTESKKSYPFKIGVAGPLPEDFVDMLETCLEKYNLANLSTGKKTPIQERPLDFPQLENMEVTYFEAEVNYPTTSQVMQEYISKCCSCPQTHIIVRNPNEMAEEYQAEKKDEPYEAILGKDDMGGESAQESVGDNRVMDLLKELETARKDNDHSPIDGVAAGESADITETENTKSVMGS